MWRKLPFMAMVLLLLALVGHRVWRYGTLPVYDHQPDMPGQVSEAEERQLHLTSGGKYTQADITANGRTVPSQKFRGFQARHDFDPLPGDRLCPITRTKANPACGWIIWGQEYTFCCPPCIDEFVRLAKQQPDKIAPAASYIKK